MDTAHFEALKTLFEETIPFNRYLGMTVEHIAKGSVHLRIPFQPEWIGDPIRPALHGGLLSTLADTAGGIAVFSALAPMPKVSTLDLRIDYLRHGLPVDLICTAEVLRVGNRVAVTSMKLTQNQGSRVLAEGRGVYNIHRSEDNEERP